MGLEKRLDDVETKVDEAMKAGYVKNKLNKLFKKLDASKLNIISHSAATISLSDQLIFRN